MPEPTVLTAGYILDPAGLTIARMAVVCHVAHELHDIKGLSINLRNIAELAIHRGDTEEAIKVGTEAHEAALATRDRIWIRRSHALLASAG